jgi:hypothetical protein
MSAHADQRTIQRAMGADPFGYIIKPFDERDVRLGIDIAIQRHRFELALKKDAATRAWNASGMIDCILSAMATAMPPETIGPLIALILVQFDEHFRPAFRKELEERQNVGEAGKWGPGETAGFYLGWLGELFKGAGFETVCKLEGNTGLVEIRACEAGGMGESLLSRVLYAFVDRSFGWAEISGKISRAPDDGGKICRYRFEFTV